ncbi:hypothetical protein SDC9_157729 [bioreactor metagenome]|uniref:Uncharacterized protein n=1 Tax=bioreactor metagenome TaxID=1076179 RepID=A0A645FD60_9ZZZZ
MSADRLESRGDRPRSGHVIVFDEGRISQSHPVVDAAAASHRVLLQHAQPRDGFAGIPHVDARVSECIDPRGGGGGHSRQLSEQVEQRALGGQQGPKRRLDLQDRITWAHPAAIADQDRGGRVVAVATGEHVQGSGGHRDPGQAAGLPGDHPCPAALGGPEDGAGRDVRAPGQVLVQRPVDDLEDEGGIEAGVLQSDPPGAEALASHAATWWPQIGSVELSATWPASSSR